MFGKGKSKMSSNDKFITAAGRAAGNLKGAGTPFNKKNALGMSDTPNRGKDGPDPYKPRTLKVGKNSRFSSE
jgi:hypothetical protein